MSPRAVLTAESLFRPHDARVGQIPWGPATIGARQIRVLLDSGFEHVDVEAREAPMDWEPLEMRFDGRMTLHTTRYEHASRRLDAWLAATKGPVLFVDPLAVPTPGDVRRFVNRCRQEGLSCAVLEVGSTPGLLWIDPRDFVRRDVTETASGRISLSNEARMVARSGRSLVDLDHDVSALAEAAESAVCPPTFEVLAPDVFAHPTARIAPDTLARCRGPIWLQKGAVVEEAVALTGPVVIGEGARVRHGSTLRRTTVMAGTEVRAHTRLANRIATPDVDGCALATPPPGPWQRSERALEQIAAATALAVLSPALAVSALAIRTEDGGPATYVSRRCVGRTRTGELRYARYPVLRTMTQGGDRSALKVLDAANSYGDGPFRKVQVDPRITRVGGVMRRTSFDELPLLWEVVRGRLSLTGVWALPPYEARDLCDEQVVGDLVHTAAVRFEGPPGLAGLWQARDRDSHDMVARLVHDAYQSAVLGHREDGPLSAPTRTARRIGLAVETVLSAMRLTGG